MRYGLWAVLLAVAFSGYAFSQSAPDTQLRYKFNYQCNGESVQVSYCRKDSDMPGFPATTPERDYCLVYYPDRPKRGGFTVQTSELRGDVIKKLQACGALSGGPTASSPASGSTSAGDNYAEGYKYFKARDYAKAVPFFREVVRLKPDYGDAWVYLGTS